MINHLVICRFNRYINCNRIRSRVSTSSRNVATYLRFVKFDLCEAIKTFLVRLAVSN